MILFNRRRYTSLHDIFNSSSSWGSRLPIPLKFTSKNIFLHQFLDFHLHAFRVDHSWAFIITSRKFAIFISNTSVVLFSFLPMYISFYLHQAFENVRKESYWMPNIWLDLLLVLFHFTCFASMWVFQLSSRDFDNKSLIAYSPVITLIFILLTSGLL